MTSEDLNEIERRAEKTTPGPWTSMIEGRDHTSGDNFIMTGTADPKNWDKRGPDIYLSDATHDDQDFIANARQDIPKLVAEVKRLKKLLEKITFSA